MPTIFERAQVEKPRMSAFDLSREQKLSCNMGELIPTYLEEVVPGDMFRVDSEIMLRLAPMLAPVMHRVNVHMHYFYVPNRLLWSQWEDFITGGQDGLTDPQMPFASYEGDSTVNTRLADYMGLPDISGTTNTAVDVNVLPFRAYQAIWNEYYRDPNLHDELDIKTLGAETYTLRQRCWEKDYLTSALPWTQRGDAPEIPIGYNDGSLVRREDDSLPSTTESLGTNTAGDVQGQTTGDDFRIENVQGVDVNELRKTTAIQRWLEKQARGGYRYIETILSNFGVEVEDYRVQRPEYLGGGKQPVQISEVLNTSATAAEPQGEMAGHGISVGQTNSFQREFKEHGYVIGIMSVLPKTAYQQGVDRHWLRRDKHDYYWPAFAHLGEQEVKNHEVYVEPNDPDWNFQTFGYQQRYAEYKYGKSSVHGDFRTNLDFWHMGRKFDTKPALNKEFVEANPTERIFAVQDEDHLWVQLHHSVKARRPMPYFSDPRLT